jgi:HAD superfamily hydrolase (TIGR01509 family)
MIKALFSDIEAVIFDMDGLLIDSEPIWKIAELKGFAMANVELSIAECKETTGLRMDEVIAYWFSRKPNNGMPQAEVYEYIIDFMVKEILLRGEPMLGAVPLVKRLHEQGYPLAVATSSPHVLLNAVLERLKLNSYFSVLASAQDESYGKPNPAVFITAAKKLGVLPEKCLIFEDSINGVIAAKASRARCIAVPEKELLNDKRFSIADAVFENLDLVSKELFVG